MANPQLEMRRKNNEHLQKVRAQKPTVKSTDSEAGRVQINRFALGALVFVVCGGIVFELLRLILA